MNATTSVGKITEGGAALRLPERSGHKSLWFAALLLGAAGAGAVLFFFDPAQHRLYPICYFHAATGLNCPGCGALRALHALLHGHFAEAAHSNGLLLLCLPLLAWAGVRGMVRHWRGQPFATTLRPARLWWLLAAAAGFALLRNLPAFAWLAPAP